MPKLVIQIVCPCCHRRQALKDGDTLPLLWFDPDADPADIDFIQYTRAYGGQGRGVKGKKKALAGFELEQSLTFREAYQSPETRDKVIALYKWNRRLVDHLEQIGIR